LERSRFKPPPEFVGGKQISVLQRAQEMGSGRCDSRSATRGRNRSVKNLALLQKSQVCRGCAAWVAESRLSGWSRGAEKLQKVALWVGFQIWD